MTPHPTILQAQGVALSFGGTQVLNQVEFDVRRGEIRAIIGPNGAGKTSMLNCISGFYRPQGGAVHYSGGKNGSANGNSHDLTRTPTHHIAGLGVARTFQNIALYTGLSTLDNLMAARHIHMRQSGLAGALYWGAALREEVAHRRVVEEIIDFLEIAHIRKAVVGALPYGLRKRVELGRALALQPELLLLDEPMAGMNAEEKEDMARFILDIHERQGTTIILIEHDMGLVMDISDRVVVLDFGTKIADGTPDAVRADGRVIQAYLGQG
ncbi:MAG: ABC transporter ATP-binding protein [Caldilineaceae bacterium]|nr:ABC transporter ATP-binding protein [Caldilineaceae bacterium]HRJ42453.1 ABC transporter ATP-binding protein [Caldilineaceae bacterium]